MRGKSRTIFSLLCLVLGACDVAEHQDVEVEVEPRQGDAHLAQEADDAQYTLFESGPVRPIAKAGNRIYVVNTPDNRLEVMKVTSQGLKHEASISVGLEPVSVAVEGNQAWVVNHLSDSVSVIALSGIKKHQVVRTLLVGDEPRDVVFAGPSGQRRAYVTTAHRGQNAPYDPQLTTPGVGRADVWVFDPSDLGQSLEGESVAVLQLFTDTPRALTVSPDGETVYAAGFHTGNQTTAVSGLFVGMGAPPPYTNHAGVPGPAPLSLIVRWDGEHWVDEDGQVWDHGVNFSLPDKDVFAIDATQDPPVLIESGEYASVGTVLFNMATNPVSGKVYVANTEALNEVRFEGAGVFTGERGVQGHIHESRITVIDPVSGAVTPRHLNKHIDYDECCDEVGNDEAQKSLAFPLDMAVTSDGQTLYVTAFGSSKIGVFDTGALETDSFVPSASDHIVVSGGGPSGVVLDEGNGRLYVTTRFDNAVSIIDTATKTEVGKVNLYNPEPHTVVEGRPFLYDAFFSSSHGDSACASCHVFGDMDSLAWDLGDPDGDVLTNPGPFVTDPTGFLDPDFHPLKGPMTTQSLRGMANHGPMHWRGDRTGGNDEPSVQPDGGSFSEDLAFKKFNPAFVGLIGRHEPIDEEDMQAFTDFILQVTYPPNPIRRLDNTLTVEQQEAADFFFESPSFPVPFGSTCNDCHVIDPQGNPDSFRPGFFGSDGRYAFEFQNQIFKVAHFRNLYQKVGMFGFPEVPEDNPFFGAVLPINNEWQGDQIRGFGFTHDGTADSVFRFLSIAQFLQHPDLNPGGLPFDEDGLQLRRNLESFVLASDSNMAPIVGQQVTITYPSVSGTTGRIALLRQRADAGECDLVAKMVWLPGLEVGWLYVGNNKFRASMSALGVVHGVLLRALAQLTHIPLTYTCAPPGNGHRIALDRDLDGTYDVDEILLGTNPADPTSHP